MWTEGEEEIIFTGFGFIMLGTRGEARPILGGRYLITTTNVSRCLVTRTLSHFLSLNLNHKWKVDDEWLEFLNFGSDVYLYTWYSSPQTWAVL